MTKLVVILLTFMIVLTQAWSCADTKNTFTSGLRGFIANVGQWPSHVLYAVRQNGANVWITRTGVVTDQYSVSENGIRLGTVTKEAFRDVNPRFVRSDGEPVSYVTFIKGSDSSQWLTAPVVSRASLVDYYPGVTFTFGLTAEGQVQRNIIVHQGADLSSIRYQILGDARYELADVTPTTSMVYGSYIGGDGDDDVTGLEYLDNGEVVVVGSTRELDVPAAAGGYSSSVKDQADGFIARFDPRLEKVLSYTFLGGDGDDRIRGVAKDRLGNIYVTGETLSRDFPVTSGGTGRSYAGQIDGFVAKLNGTLTELLVGSYHGGIKDDYCRAIAVDRDFNIYVAGGTTSPDMPTNFPDIVTFNVNTVQPYVLNFPGGGALVGQLDGFVARFSSSGARLRSRYLGGSENDIFSAIYIDGEGYVFVGGSSASKDYLTTPRVIKLYSRYSPLGPEFLGGAADAVVVKMSPELELSFTKPGLFSTFLGGDGFDEVRSITVDDKGQAYVFGSTTSKNLPAEGSLFPRPLGGRDAFLAVISNDGAKLLGCTYFGGSGDDIGMCVRFLQGTTVAVAGVTSSQDFPAEGPGAVATSVGRTDGFLSKISLATNHYSTLVSGLNEDTIKAIVPDPLGDIYFLAATTSPDIITYSTSASQKQAGVHGYLAKHAFGIVELTAPTGGEVYCVGTSKPISWSAQGFPDTTRFQIQYSEAGSGKWVDLIKNVGGRSFSWKVPNVPTGKYEVRLSTTRGHMSRLLTPFTISNPPTITTQPKDASACPGGPAVLRLKADGAGLKYQWRRAGSNIAGATADSLVVTVDATTLGKYDCLVSGTCNPSVTSASVNLTTAVATAITRQPTGLTVQSGSPFTLSVSATGSTLSYQWSRNGAPISGATSAEYTVATATPADAGDYTCAVTGGCGTVTSEKAAVVVEGLSVDEEEIVASAIRLVGRHPVADEAAVRIDLPLASDVTVSVVDLRGRTLESLTVGGLSSGMHDVVISTKACQSGMHALKVSTAAGTWTLPLMVVR